MTTITPKAIDKIKAELRQDIRVGVVTAAAAAKALGISRKKFYQRAAEAGTCIRASSGEKGKYIWTSIKQEFKRIHGVRYEEAAGA